MHPIAVWNSLTLIVFFQDRTSEKMIGSAKMMDGLYYFQDTSENKEAQGLSGI